MNFMITLFWKMIFFFFFFFLLFSAGYIEHPELDRIQNNNNNN